MFEQLAQLQSAAVNALLDQIEDDPDWRQAFVHAEFRDVGVQAESLIEAFLVPASPEPDRPRYIPLDPDAVIALEALYKGYRDAGQGFARLDLVVAAPDGRYRFTFDDAPSLRMQGRRDPDADAYLLARYAELLAEG